MRGKVDSDTPPAAKKTSAAQSGPRLIRLEMQCRPRNGDEQHAEDDPDEGIS